MVRCPVKLFLAYLVGVIKDSTVEAMCSKIVAALKAERERQQLSMNALAERAGLSQQMVSYVERGLRRPTLDTVVRMAIALDVDLSAIIRAVLVR